MKRRVVAGAAVLLLVSKLVAVATPVLYKWAVDLLAGEFDGPGYALALGAIGTDRRLRPVPAGQRRASSSCATRSSRRSASRRCASLAAETFRHIHACRLRYHLTRKTGALSRVIERGVKGVSFLLNFLVMSIGPLVLELLLIFVIFAVAFDWRYLAAVVATIAAYVGFTFAVTEWRVRIRKEMNEGRPGREPEGDRQPAELRDGEVFRRRGARGAALRDRDGGLPALCDPDRVHARRS